MCPRDPRSRFGPPLVAIALVLFPAAWTAAQPGEVTSPSAFLVIQPPTAEEQPTQPAEGARSAEGARAADRPSQALGAQDGRAQEERAPAEPPSSEATESPSNAEPASVPPPRPARLSSLLGGPRRVRLARAPNMFGDFFASGGTGQAFSQVSNQNAFIDTLTPGGGRRV